MILLKTMILGMDIRNLKIRSYLLGKNLNSFKDLKVQDSKIGLGRTVSDLSVNQEVSFWHEYHPRRPN